MTVVTPNLLPENYELVHVRGRYLNLDGTPGVGVMRFESSTRLLSITTHTIILPKPISVTLAADGSWSVYLPSTDDPDITPQGWFYRVTEPDGTTHDYAIHYDTVGDLFFDTLAEEILPTPETVSYLSSALAGKPNGVATLDGGGNVPKAQLGNLRDKIHVQATDPGEANSQDGDVWFRYTAT